MKLNSYKYLVICMISFKLQWLKYDSSFDKYDSSFNWTGF